MTALFLFAGQRSCDVAWQTISVIHLCIHEYVRIWQDYTDRNLELLNSFVYVVNDESSLRCQSLIWRGVGKHPSISVHLHEDFRAVAAVENKMASIYLRWVDSQDQDLAQVRLQT